MHVQLQGDARYNKLRYNKVLDVAREFQWTQGARYKLGSTVYTVEPRYTEVGYNTILL